MAKIGRFHMPILVQHRQLCIRQSALSQGSHSKLLPYYGTRITSKISVFAGNVIWHSTQVLTFLSSREYLRRSTRRAPDGGPPSRRRRRRRENTRTPARPRARTCLARHGTATSSCSNTLVGTSNSALKHGKAAHDTVRVVAM